MRCTVLLVTLMVCTVSFIYGTQSSPVKQCEDIQQACNHVERISSRPFVQSLCNCTTLAMGECEKNWDHGANTVTWSAPRNKDVEHQFKFCLPIKKGSCNKGQTAAILNQTEDSWIYEMQCKCRSHYAILDKVEQKSHGLWEWFLVCEKRVCSRNEDCVKRYTRHVNGMYLTDYTYLCACPGYEKCPDPEADRNVNSGDEKGEFHSTTFSKCI